MDRRKFFGTCGAMAASAAMPAYSVPFPRNMIRITGHDGDLVSGEFTTAGGGRGTFTFQRSKLSKAIPGLAVGVWQEFDGWVLSKEQ